MPNSPCLPSLKKFTFWDRTLGLESEGYMMLYVILIALFPIMLLLDCVKKNK